MTTLKFGNAITKKGFTGYATAAFNDASPVKIVREVIQNSLDAAVEAGEPCAIVRFRLRRMRPGDVPDLRGYERAFKGAVEYSSPLPDAAEEVAERIRRALKMLRTKKARLLSITDNGIGLDNVGMQRLLGDGAGAKSRNLAGSYGVGHLAPMAISDLRYLLYGGLTKDGDRIASGKAVLASHRGTQRLLDADGYLIKEFGGTSGDELYRFIAKRKHPPVIAGYLDEIEKEWGHGCVVLIPAFNNFKNFQTKTPSLRDIVFKVAAYNFSPAIYRGNLILEVCVDEEPQQRESMDASSLADFLEKEKDGIRAARSNSFFGGLRPSGRQAAGVLTALTGGTSHPVSFEGGQVTISLREEADVNYCCVDLFRNGMRITDRVPSLTRADFADRRPFHAVLEVNAENGGELHRFIRKAESPMHDGLEFKLLSDLEREKLVTSLKEVGDWIREHVPAISTDTYTIDDVLLVDTGDSSQPGRQNFAFWGTPTPITRRHVQITPTGNADDRADVPNRTESSAGGSGAAGRQTPTAPLPFQSVIAPEGRDMLVGSFMSMEGCRGVKAIIRLDENTDSTCDRVWEDEDIALKNFWIASEASGGKPIACTITGDRRWAEIPEIKAGENYSIKIEHAPLPADLVAAVRHPVLRIDLYKLKKSSGDKSR